MAQTSLPQAGSGVGDSGPYTAADWAKFYEIVFTGDQAATQGVLRNYLNELEVTLVGNTISVDTGAGFSYGHWLLNDASVDINVTACAGVETRWDRVVLVQNETAAVYNTSLLLPAAYAAGVPRNSCRIAILRGVCGSPGVLPTLLTGPNYYMVELARYQVTGGSAGAVTDYRDFCNFSTEVGADWIENRTRRFFVPVTVGYNIDTLADIPVAYHAGLLHAPYVILPDDDVAQGGGMSVVPSDYASGMTVRTVLTSMPAGNVVGQTFVHWGECGEFSNAGFSSNGSVVASIVGNRFWNCIDSVSAGVPDGSNENFLSLIYRRNPALATDTVNDEVWISGWIISYTADS
jgi:hypothetical protein